MARARAAACIARCGLLLLVAASSGCGKGAPSPAGSTPAVTPAAGEVVVVAVRPGGGSGSDFQGFLEPVVDAVVPAQAAGIVREVFVREGERVGKGARLARLESEEQRLEVDYNSALAEQAAAELDRAEKGAAGQFVSKQSLDAARAKARATRVDLELARLAYAKRTLRAPVAGVVWQVRAEPHRLVAADDILFRVTDPGRLRTHLYLPATMLRRIHVGDAAMLTPTGEPGTAAVAGRVRTVSPIVDPATGLFRVEVEVAGNGQALAGQTVEAVFPGLVGVGEGKSALLPGEALVEREDDRLFVFRDFCSFIRNRVCHRNDSNALFDRRSIQRNDFLFERSLVAAKRTYLPFALCHRLNEPANMFVARVHRPGELDNFCVQH